MSLWWKHWWQELNTVHSLTEKAQPKTRQDVARSLPDGATAQGNFPWKIPRFRRVSRSLTSQHLTGRRTATETRQQTDSSSNAMWNDLRVVRPAPRQSQPNTAPNDALQILLRTNIQGLSLSTCRAIQSERSLSDALNCFLKAEARISDYFWKFYPWVKKSTSFLKLISE